MIIINSFISFESDPLKKVSDEYLEKEKILTCEIIRCGTDKQLQKLNESCFVLAISKEVRDVVFAVLTLNGFSVEKEKKKYFD